MQTRKTDFNPYYGILISLASGVLIGLLSVLLIAALNHIEQIHQSSELHLLLIPVVLVLIYTVRRNTLYFPIKVSQLDDTEAASLWSPVMLPVHFLGTLISHLCGVSVGREGAMVLSAGGLARLLRLEWEFWGPVFCSVAFASVVGQYWVAPVFMLEMFGRTNQLQKIFSLMGAVAAVLTGQYFQVPHFFPVPEVQLTSGFFSSFTMIGFFAITAGLLMRYYKKLYQIFSEIFFKSSLWVKLAVAVVLGVFLYLPEFRGYQSLSLSQIQDLPQFEGSALKAFTKLIFTLVSTSLGFLGGEFIPLVFSGVHLGASFFAAFGQSSQLGALFGAFVLFAGATRFKWTSYILLLGLAGWQFWFWAYLLMALTVSFSGELSLYRKNHL